jgi:hypothetical protein
MLLGKGAIIEIQAVHLIEREPETERRETTELVSYLIVLVCDGRMAELENKVLRQRGILGHEEDEIVEEFFIGQRMRRYIAEKPDIPVLIVLVAQLLDTPEQHQVVNRGNQPLALDNGYILAGRDHLAGFTADPGISFIEFTFALRQADNRM